MSSLMDKIQMVDPMNALAPMRADKDGNFGGQGGQKDDREKSVSEVVKEEIENRMEKAQQDLQKKYARGEGGRDNGGGEGPTGAAYTQAAVAERERRRALKDQEAAAEGSKTQTEQKREAEVRAQVWAANEEEEDSDRWGAQAGEEEEEEEEDSDDELLNELEGGDDPELARLRMGRLAALKQEQLAKMALLRAGYGGLSEIVQDEFLPRVTPAARCVVHFYHNDFHRCKIMDHHLSLIAARHMGTLFLKINAEKAPFFCEKLNVRVLPTVIFFREGKTKPEERQIGFINLEPKAGGSEDEWPTEALEANLGALGAIDYVKQATRDELARYGLLEKGSITASRRTALTRGGEDEDDE